MRFLRTRLVYHEKRYGDAGFKLGKGSSTYFAIAAVFFDDNLDAEEAALKIKRLRKKLGWSSKHEFKFRKTSANVKQQFFETIRSLNFRVIIALINKHTLQDRALRKNASVFYNTVILSAIRASSVPISNAHIYIDGEAGSDYRRRVKTFFRQNLPKRSIVKITYKDSREDNLIQLADMVAGAAIRSSEATRDDAKIYLSFIKKHIEAIITEV